MSELLARLRTGEARLRAEGGQEYQRGLLVAVIEVVARHDALVADVMTVVSDPHLTWEQARAKLAAALTAAMVPGSDEWMAQQAQTLEEEQAQRCSPTSGRLLSASPLVRPPAAEREPYVGGPGLKCPYCGVVGCVCTHLWGDSCRCPASIRPHGPTSERVMRHAYGASGYVPPAAEGERADGWELIREIARDCGREAESLVTVAGKRVRDTQRLDHAVIQLRATEKALLSIAQLLGSAFPSPTREARLDEIARETANRVNTALLDDWTPKQLDTAEAIIRRALDAAREEE